MQTASNKQYGFKSKQSTKICYWKHFKKETENKTGWQFLFIQNVNQGSADQSLPRCPSLDKRETEGRQIVIKS